MLSEIQEIRQGHKNIGVQQIQKRLKKTSASYGTVYRLCKENGLMAHRKPHSITRRDPNAIAANDLVARDFSAAHPGEKVLNDITEMQCKDGKLYLAATLDCFDGAIIGMAMDDNKRAEICCASFENARKRFGLAKDVIVHSGNVLAHFWFIIHAAEDADTSNIHFNLQQQKHCFSDFAHLLFVKRAFCE